MECLKTYLTPDQAKKGGPTCREAYLMTKTLQLGQDSQPVQYTPLTPVSRSVYKPDTLNSRVYLSDPKVRKSKTLLL